MSAWIKKTTGTTQSAWGKASKIWVKTSNGTTQASWGRVLTGWVKVTTGTTQAAWRKFFINQTDVPINTVSPSITAANYATTNLSGTQALLGTTLTGGKGTWTSANGTISYTYLWFANGVSTGVVTTTFSTAGYDGQNITFQVTATNNSGYTLATSSQLQVTKNKPVNTSVSLSNNAPNVGDTLSINTNWTLTTTFTNDTVPDYYIATFTTNSGIITKDSRNTSSWNQYVVLSSDVGHTISAYVTAYNTGAPSGVSTSTVTTNTIVVNPGPFTYSIIDTSANRGPNTPSVTSSVSNNTLYLNWSTTTLADQYREYLNSGPVSYTGYYPVAGPSTFTSDSWSFSSSGTESITFYSYNTLNGQVAVTYGGSSGATYYTITYGYGGNAYTTPNLASGNIYFINVPMGTPVTVYSVVAYNNSGGSTGGTTTSTNPLTPTTKVASVTNTYSLTYVAPGVAPNSSNTFATTYATSLQVGGYVYASASSSATAPVSYTYQLQYSFNNSTFYNQGSPGNGYFLVSSDVPNQYFRYYITASNAYGSYSFYTNSVGPTQSTAVPAPTNLIINLTYNAGPSWTASWSATYATSYTWAFYVASDSSGTNMTYVTGGGPSGTTSATFNNGGTGYVWGKLYVTAYNSSGSTGGSSAWT